MLTRTLLPTALVSTALALSASGCGLLETNDDELETLRVEIIQLREDFMEMEAEVSLLVQRSVPTTVAPTPTTAAPATTTSMAVAEDEGSAEVEAEVPTVSVPVGLNEDAILTATYQWGPSDPAVILQELLGVTADGWYGNGTRTAHLAELEARALDTSGVPSPPTTTTAAPSEDEATEATDTGDGASADDAVDETSDGTADDSTDGTADDSTDGTADDSTDVTTTTEAPAETTTTVASE